MGAFVGTPSARCHIVVQAGAARHNSQAIDFQERRRVNASQCCSCSFLAERFAKPLYPQKLYRGFSSRLRSNSHIDFGNMIPGAYTRCWRSTRIQTGFISPMVGDPEAIHFDVLSPCRRSAAVRLVPRSRPVFTNVSASAVFGLPRIEPRPTAICVSSVCQLRPGR